MDIEVWKKLYLSNGGLDFSFKVCSLVFANLLYSSLWYADPCGLCEIYWGEISLCLIWIDNYVLFLSMYHVRQLKVWTKKPNALQQIFLSCPNISLEEEMHSLGCSFQFFVIPKDPNNTLLDVIFLRYFKCFCNEALVTCLCSWFCNHVCYSVIKVVFFFFLV